MTDDLGFDAALREARAAHRETLRADDAATRRNRLLAQAWDLRPADYTYQDLVSAICYGTPPPWPPYGTLRRWVREGARHARLGQRRGVAVSDQGGADREEDPLARDAFHGERSPFADLAASYRAPGHGDDLAGDPDA